MEDYAAKMLRKTDADLREYVTGHVQYREAAVLAALDELRRRGQPAPEEAALRPGLQAGAETARIADAAEAARQQQAPATSPSPGNKADDEAEPTGPALFSPGMVVVFSLLFSILAGGVLLGLNLARLRRWNAVAGLAGFLVVYLTGWFMALSWLMAHFGLNPLLSLALQLPAIAVYLLWFWPRYLGNEPHRSRSWLLPFLVFLALAWAVQLGSKYLLKRQPKQVQQQVENLMK